MKQRVIFIVGPTAVGKTEAAYLLAKKIKGEIISCDSMQVYRSMDIITSKPKKLLQKNIPHHMLGVVSPQKPYDVSQYRKEAVIKAKQILKNGRVPIFAGGTGLYVSILIDGIFEAKAQNEGIRSRLYKEAEESGGAYLYEKLKKVDPQAAGKIHLHDTKRIVRALEVCEVTGEPISKLQGQRKGLSSDYEIKIFALDMDRDTLYQRIDARVDKMFASGLVKEVKNLLKLRLSRTAACAIGIRELKGYFSGKYDIEEARGLIKKNSRNYAKRQLTWFRKDKRIQWIKIKNKQTPQDIARKIWNALS